MMFIILVKMVKKKDNVEYYVPKTITIRKDQAEYINKVSMNLSKFVQKQLDEQIKK